MLVEGSERSFEKVDEERTMLDSKRRELGRLSKGDFGNLFDGRFATSAAGVENLPGSNGANPAAEAALSGILRDLRSSSGSADEKVNPNPLSHLGRLVCGHREAPKRTIDLGHHVSLESRNGERVAGPNRGRHPEIFDAQQLQPLEQRGRVARCFPSECTNEGLGPGRCGKLEAGVSIGSSGTAPPNGLRNRHRKRPLRVLETR